MDDWPRPMFPADDPAVPERDLRFSDFSSSACLAIRCLTSNHVFSNEALSKMENGRGAPRWAVFELEVGGGMAERGSSMASGEV